MEFISQSPKLPNVVAVPFKPNSVSPLMEHLSQQKQQFLSAPAGLVQLPGPYQLASLYPIKGVPQMLQAVPMQAAPTYAVPPQLLAAALHQQTQQSRAHTSYVPSALSTVSPTSPITSSSIPSIATPSSVSPISLDADEKSLDDDLSPSGAQDESSTTADESSVSHSHSISSLVNNAHSHASSSSSSEEDDKLDSRPFSEAECEMAQFLSTLASALPPRDIKRPKKPYKINLAKPDFDFAIKRRNVTKTGRPKESHVCPNCHVTESTLWRNCTVNGKSLYFCNACGLRYKKGKYCGMCYKVYYDADTNHRDWKQCSYCLNWTHKQCLVDSGNTAACDEAYPYACTACAAHNL